MIKKKTFFCDIDGTLIKYREFVTYQTNPAVPIESTINYITEQFNDGHMIILTIARTEELRRHTELELEMNHIPFHRLIMGIERGPRYLINDMSPNEPGERAIGFNLVRDQGI